MSADESAAVAGSQGPSRCLTCTATVLLPAPARFRPADPTRGATVVRPRPGDEAATVVRAIPPQIEALEDEDVTTLFAPLRDALPITRPELPLATTTTIAAVIPWTPWPPPALLDTPRDLPGHRASASPSRIAAIVLVVLAALSCVGGGALLAHAALRPTVASR